jgi:WD40 repeat protein/subtilisin-like proprotein convertase family protein
MAGDFTDKAPSGERDVLDSTGEFFSVGAPLHAIRAGYIRRKADEQLYDTVMSGQYAHVLAPDRSGKSSLIAATAARLENNGRKVAILDLEQIGVRDGGGDAGRWYYNVAYRLLRQLRIRYDLLAWWQDKSVLSNRQRLLDFYSEIILQFVPERIVVFVDEIQCIEEIRQADQLLASIRAAHNARTTDPDFSRLSFVLIGECDPISLIEEAELSPFNVTQQISLGDFSRDDLDLFSTELNLGADDARLALDRIFYWTRGQPYLSQKLARAIAREDVGSDIAQGIDRLASQQLAGRAALHSEPHMSHIHRAIANSGKRKEPLLNLYGKIRKGMTVAADLGSPLQRRLMAIGLVEINQDGNLQVRNRLYERVFTARWANENLPIRLGVPAIVVGAILVLVMIPFVYMQWLPRPYQNVLTSPTATTDVAGDAYRNLRSFPGHADIADSLYRNYLTQRALAASNEIEIRHIAGLASELPDVGRMPQALEAQFWDREIRSAKRAERRDDALIAALRSLVLATPQRRQTAANLVGDDYPLLLASLPAVDGTRTVFDPVNMVLTAAAGSQISQWSYAPQALQKREDWTVTALEVVPLVRRVVVDREGVVSRVGLTLNLSHARMSDLRVKIIAPSGRAIEVETGLERASSGEDIRIGPRQLRELVGESLAGTWSISVRDENPGIAGQFVGWNLQLNSQGTIEDFQRGLNIPEPVERETEDIWFDTSGRYAVARAMQSDSARIWDLAFAEPVRAVAVNEAEALIGLDAGAKHLVTATQDSVNLWETSSGDKVTSIPIGAASTSARLTAGATHLFVERRSDLESKLQLWSLATGELSAEITVAGAPSLVAIDAAGTLVAVADYDRAVRIWDFSSGDLRAQIDLPLQPSEIRLASGGDTLGVVYGESGVSIWSIDKPQQPLLEELGAGPWQLIFSPSGASAFAGRPDIGFQMYGSADGRLIGPPIGVRANSLSPDILSYSGDEKVVITGDAQEMLRVWKAPTPSVTRDASTAISEHQIWKPGADRALAALPDASGFIVGNPEGYIHVIPGGTGPEAIKAIDDDVSFVGHNADVRRISLNTTGSLAASAASDNSIRIWNTATGQPLPHTTQIAGAVISRMVFSPDSSLLGILNDDRVSLLDTESGQIKAQFELGEAQAGIAFATDNQLYVGGSSGALRLISDTDGIWKVLEVWQGAAAIRWLEASPRGEYLILVDENNLVSQFILAEGRVADSVLQLSSSVQDVSFRRGGSRVLFRTSRWVHQASVSAVGLVWQDSVFAPKTLRDARAISGNPDTAANRVYVPAIRNEFVELVELSLRGSSNPGLFGNKDELLSEWSRRLEGLVSQPES